MDPYIKLAKEAIEAYVKNKALLSISPDLPEEMLKNQAGVFISLHLKDDSLRGCIGTFAPTQENIAQEIIQNAISAATQDPRFPPIKSEELSEIVYSVDILSASKSISKDKLSDPKKYGLIVSAKDNRRGLLLPDLPGVDTIEEQIRICRLKAGIEPQKTVNYHIFTVERHTEH